VPPDVVLIGITEQVAACAPRYARPAPNKETPDVASLIRATHYLGHGVGRLLMQELIDSCAAAGFRQMIGYIDSDNTASLAIHDKFGFHRVGLLPGVAYRYGRWADTVMVQRSLAAGSTEPPQPASFSR